MNPRRLGRRWWLWPLVVAAVVDIVLVGRFEASAGLAVDRAVVRTVDGGACEQAVLIRGSGSDQLFLIDTWRAAAGVVSVPATASFQPGAGLTAESQAEILSGREVDLTLLRRPTRFRPNQQPLLLHYLAQIDQAASWLQGPCVPFANPFQSHLRRVGTLLDEGKPYVVYRGEVRYARGNFQLFQRAMVWMGIRSDGRMGFEVLRQESAPKANPALVEVATLFEYPRQHLNAAFVRLAPTRREHFYRTEYDRVLATLVDLDHEGFARGPR